MSAAQKIHTLHTARPPADQFRLAALQRYQVLDTPACEDFTFLTELAARLCNVPYAFISLVDSDRVWFKASIGSLGALGNLGNIGNPGGVGVLDSLPREHWYCSLAVLGAHTTEIADLTQDSRTATMPLTLGAPFLRRYSSVALMSPDGYAIGTLCVLDTVPGRLDAEQQRMLVKLARQAMALIELRAKEKALTASMHQLEQLATTDELTGLHNRRALLQRLSFESARARRFRSPLSAVMIDLDHFKLINDTHGHAAGDMVLANVGKLLADSVRVIDIAARYGGEELCVILPNTPIEGACLFAEKMRQRIKAQLHQVGTRLLPVTASLGVAAFDHMDIADAESLLQRTDEALYRAKHAGRNRVEC